MLKTTILFCLTTILKNIWIDLNAKTFSNNFVLSWQLLVSILEKYEEIKERFGAKVALSKSKSRSTFINDEYCYNEKIDLLFNELNIFFFFSQHEPTLLSYIWLHDLPGFGVVRMRFLAAILDTLPVPRPSTENSSSSI